MTNLWQVYKIKEIMYADSVEHIGEQAECLKSISLEIQSEFFLWIKNCCIYVRWQVFLI
jgi:hypothetical protein